MKMIGFHENHGISWNSLIFWIPRPFTKPFVFLAQNQGLSGLDPPKPKNTIKTMIFIKITNIPQFSAEFLKILQKHAKNSFWRILVVPWRPHAENLVIPIGILMFLSLPGGPETLQNTKKEKIT